MKLSKRTRPSDLGFPDGPDCVELIRAPFMPMLCVDTGRPIIHSSFISPMLSNGVGALSEVTMRLGSRMRLASDQIPVYQPPPDCRSKSGAGSGDDSDDESGPEITLWTPDYDSDPDSWEPVLVDRMLSRVLREHQVEGVKFLFDCLMGFRGPSGTEGCILADDMGLGKTLQSISIIWSLLHSNTHGRPEPAVRQALVLCPASLVKNWASEFDKWTRKKCVHVSVAESTRDKVIGQFTNFRYSQDAQVLICSYESFRLHCALVAACPIDLVVCDEAHRLKNDKTKISVCISNLPARKRLLLTGTPIQNDMSEFFAMISLALPALSTDDFNKRFSLPIARGRDPSATDKERAAGDTALSELSTLSSSFILRRTNVLLSKLLPTKHLLIVFCALSGVQRELYAKIADWLMRSSEKAGGRNALRASMLMMKLCCHPSLLDRSCYKPGEPLAGSECSRGGQIDFNLSGKLTVLKSLLVNFKKHNDKCVVISTFTSCLDAVERLCQTLTLKCVTLDGSVSITRRHELVTRFNQSSSSTSTGAVVFLLSSKAGGCGINLIGANRLVMLDADWNPATDKQAMARVWREGQKKTCWIYRLFSTGTIEEKILQRQINKDGLSASVVGTGDASGLKEALSKAEIRNLFALKPQGVASDTHQVLQCKECSALQSRPKCEYSEGNLNTWDHLRGVEVANAPLLINEGCLEGGHECITMVMYSAVENHKLD